MKIPKHILKRVNELKQTEEALKTAEKINNAKWKQRLEELEKLRVGQIDELGACATFVTYWLKDFYTNKNGRKLIEAKYRLTIFCATFWGGFPCADSRTTFATIQITKDGDVFYCERYKGMPAHETHLGNIDESPCLSATLLESSMIFRLHPKYLKQFKEAIESGAVWKYIENSLR